MQSTCKKKFLLKSVFRSLNFRSQVLSQNAVKQNLHGCEILFGGGGCCGVRFCPLFLDFLDPPLCTLSLSEIAHLKCVCFRDCH